MHALRNAIQLNHEPEVKNTLTEYSRQQVLEMLQTFSKRYAEIDYYSYLVVTLGGGFSDACGTYSVVSLWEKIYSLCVEE